MTGTDTLSDKAIRAVLKRAVDTGKPEKVSDGAGLPVSPAPLIAALIALSLSVFDAAIPDNSPPLEATWGLLSGILSGQIDTASGAVRPHADIKKPLSR